MKLNSWDIKEMIAKLQESDNPKIVIIQSNNVIPRAYGICIDTDEETTFALFVQLIKANPGIQHLMVKAIKFYAETGGKTLLNEEKNIVSMKIT